MEQTQTEQTNKQTKTQTNKQMYTKIIYDGTL